MGNTSSGRPSELLACADSRITDYVVWLENELQEVQETNDRKCFKLKEEIGDLQFELGKYMSQNEYQNVDVDIINDTKCIELQEENDRLKFEIRKHIRQEEFQKNILEHSKDYNLKLENENELLKTQLVRLQEEIEKLKKTPSETPSTSKNSITNNNSIVNKDPDPDANSVLIKGFTERQGTNMPQISVINLGSHMQIKISENDIVKIKMMERKYYSRHNLKPNKVILIVQFRTAELKVEFIKNKEKLKHQPKLEDIEITDYVSEEVFNLYQYAKILKDHGYALIYWRNNCVYAKKKKYSEPILLKSKNDVDSLK